MKDKNYLHLQNCGRFLSRLLLNQCCFRGLKSFLIKSIVNLSIIILFFSQYIEKSYFFYVPYSNNLFISLYYLLNLFISLIHFFCNYFQIVNEFR